MHARAYVAVSYVGDATMLHVGHAGPLGQLGIFA